METVNPIVFIVVGAVLFISLSIFLFRYFLKRKRKKQLLKEGVAVALGCVKANEIERNSLWLCYRLLLSKITYRPTQIHEDLVNSSFPIEKETSRLLGFFRPKTKGFWKLVANIFYEPDLIPDRYLKTPKLTIKGLEKMLNELQKLISNQVDLIDMFEDKTDERMPWKDEEGEKILISKVEWQSFMREAGDLKEEKEFEIAMLEAEIDGAKAKLEMSIDYVNTRQSGKSLEIGEHSIIGGARYLDFKEVKKYSKKILKEVTVLETEGCESRDIVNLCLSASLNLERNFEDWAKKIFERQFGFDGIQAYLKQLGESQNTEILATKKMADSVLNLFQNIIPKNWNNVDWDSLKENIKEVDEILEKMNTLAKDLEYWAGEIIDLETRIQEVLAKEELLKEKYGKTVTPSREWSKALASWKNNVSSLWANNLQDELERTLKNLDIPLLEHSFKVGNSLDEAETLAGVTTATTTQAVIEKPSSRFSGHQEIAAKLVEIEQAGQPPNETSLRTRKPPSYEPEKKLSGNMVKVISHGIEMEVDSSLADLYQKVDSAPKKKEEKK